MNDLNNLSIYPMTRHSRTTEERRGLVVHSRAIELADAHIRSMLDIYGDYYTLCLSSWNQHRDVELEWEPKYYPHYFEHQYDDPEKDVIDVNYFSNARRVQRVHNSGEYFFGPDQCLEVHDRINRLINVHPLPPSPYEWYSYLPEVEMEILQGNSIDRVLGYEHWSRPRADYFFYDCSMINHAIRSRHSWERAVCTRRSINRGLLEYWVPSLPEEPLTSQSATEIREFLEASHSILEIWQEVKNLGIACQFVSDPIINELDKFTRTFEFVLKESLIQVYIDKHLVGFLVQDRNRRFSIINQSGYKSLAWKAKGLTLGTLYLACENDESIKFGKCYPSQLFYELAHPPIERPTDALTRDFLQLSIGEAEKAVARLDNARKRTWTAKEHSKHLLRKSYKVLLPPKPQVIPAMDQDKIDFPTLKISHVIGEKKKKTYWKQLKASGMAKGKTKQIRQRGAPIFETRWHTSYQPPFKVKQRGGTTKYTPLQKRQHYETRMKKMRAALENKRKSRYGWHRRTTMPPPGVTIKNIPKRPIGKHNRDENELKIAAVYEKTLRLKGSSKAPSVSMYVKPSFSKKGNGRELKPQFKAMFDAKKLKDKASADEPLNSHMMVDVLEWVAKKVDNVSETITNVAAAVDTATVVVDHVATGSPLVPPDGFFDGLFSKIESIAFLLGSLYKSDQSVTAYICAVGQWIKALGFHPSLSACLHHRFDQLLRMTSSTRIVNETQATPLAGATYVPEGLQSQADEPWKFTDIKGLLEKTISVKHWKEVKNSQFVISLMDIYMELVVEGWMPELMGNKSKYSVTGYALDMLQKKVAQKRDSSMCLAECLFDSFVYVVEHVFTAIKYGSPTFLFMENAELAALESEYADIVSASAMIENEDVHRCVATNPFKDFDDYVRRVDALMERLEEMRKMDTANKSVNQMMQSPFAARILALKKIRVMLTEHFRNSCVREKPFAVMIYGGTGVGKTTITQQLIAHLAPTLGIDLTADKVCNVNEADKYDSDYRQGHEVVVIDDMANKKLEHYTEGGPVDKYLRIVNTASTAALKADVNSKGNVFYRPKLVIVTTNVKDVLSASFSNEPASIMRRFDVILTCSAKKPFTTLDGSLNSVTYKKAVSKGVTLPDAWDIVFQQVTVVRTNRGDTGAKDGVSYVTLDATGKQILKPTPINIYDTITQLRMQAIVHMDRQAGMVAEIRKLYSSDSWCNCPPAMRWSKGCCPICDAEESVAPKKKKKKAPLSSEGHQLRRLPPRVRPGSTQLSPVSESSMQSAEDQVYPDVVNEPYTNVRVVTLPASTVSVSDMTPRDNVYPPLPASSLRKLEPTSDPLVKVLPASLASDASFHDPGDYRIYYAGEEDELEAYAPLHYQGIPLAKPFTWFHNPVPKDQPAPIVAFRSADNLMAFLLCGEPEDGDRYIEFGGLMWKEITAPCKKTSVIVTHMEEPSVLSDTQAYDEEDSHYDPPTEITASVYMDFIRDFNIDLVGGYVALANRYKEQFSICPLWGDFDLADPTGDWLDDFNAQLTPMVQFAVKCLFEFTAGCAFTYATWVAFKGMKHMILAAFSYLAPQLQEESEAVVITPLAQDSKALRKLPVITPKLSACATTTVPQDLRSQLSIHLLEVLITDLSGSGTMRRGIAVPLKGSFILLPKHVVFPGPMSIECTCSFDNVGKISHVDGNNWLQVPNQDLVVMHVPSLGARKSFVDYFPLRSASPNYAAGILLVKRDGVYTEIVAEEFRMRDKIRTVQGAEFYGYRYKPKEATRPGDCASPVVSLNRAVIIGVHLAGSNPGRPLEAACASPYKEDLDDVMEMMSATDHAVVVTSEGGYPETRFGHSDVLTEDIPLRHSLNSLDGEPCAINVLGAHKRGSTSFRSQLGRFPWSDRVLAEFALPDSHLTPREAKSLGMLKVSEQWANDIQKLARCGNKFDPHIWKLAKDDFRFHIHMVCQKDSNAQLLAQMGVLDESTTLHGVDGVNYVYSIDFSTSAGYPLNRPKRDYLTEEDTRKATFKPEIWREVSDMEERLANGVRCHAPFRACLKDEILSKHKVKLRVFSGCNVAFTLLTRKYFLSIIRFICANWLDMECAVGINPYGADWGVLVKHLMSKGSSDRLIAGDYGSYDKLMSAQASMGGFDMILTIASYGRYDQRDLAIMRGIAVEICYPLYEYDGVMIEVSGSNPSGHALTVILNSMVNSLYQRYAFKIPYPKLTFAEHVALMTFGDDANSGVSNSVPEHNMASVSRRLGEVGIRFTLSDEKKSDGSTLSYQNIEDVTFLKRAFVWDSEYDRWMAPLSRSSILKSMLFFNSRKNRNTYIQTELYAMGLVASLREWAMYGRYEFDARKQSVVTLLKEVKQDKWMNLWTYDEYMGALDSYPPRILGGNWLTWLEESEEESITPLHSHQLEGVEIEVVRNDLRCVKTLVHTDEYSDWYERKTTACGVGPPELCCIMKRPTNNNTINTLLTGKSEHGGEHADNVPSLHNQAELVQFSDASNDISGYSASEDPLSGLIDTPEFSLNTFLERPVQIQKYVIPATNTTFAAVMSPWTRFLSNKRVINKINNYAYIRGDLVVKFVVNGTPFHHGRMIASYEPLPQLNTGIAPTSIGASFHLGDIMRWSQRPHVWLNPTDSQGGEMVLPFIWPENMATLRKTDFNDLGTLTLASVFNIRALSISPAEVTINVYAWMENVVLALPTVVDAGMLTSQGDEYGTTPVSDVATAISNAAGKLEHVPVIGKYARATSLAAGAAADVARAMGYSKPTQLTISTVKPAISGNLSNFNAIDTSTRLTVDAKQELSVNPTSIGVKSVDDMDINTLCKKETVVALKQWSTGHAPGVHLFSMAVAPKAFYVGPPHPWNLNNPICQTPASFLSPMFQYWRGNMALRVQVVKSAFHSGRLRIVFDPFVSDMDLYGESRDNLIHTWIVDIGETDDITIDCGWTQRTSFLPCHVTSYAGDVYTEPNNALSTAAPSYMSLNGFSNGMVTVTVLNPLVVPDNALDQNTTAAGLIISVWWRDIEFAAPIDDYLTQLTYLPRYEAPIQDLSSQSEEISEATQFYTPIPTDETYAIYMGERVTSIRQMLKRFTRHNTIQAFPAGEETAAMVFYRQPAFPYTTGYSESAPHFDINGQSVSYVPLTYITYLTPMYLGWRGSVRWKYVTDIALGAFGDISSLMTVTRTQFFIVNQDLQALDNSTSPSELAYSETNALACGGMGIAHTHTSINPNLEVEVPFYSRYKMGAGRDLKLGFTHPTVSPLINMDNQGMDLRVKVNPQLKQQIRTYVATGEDFILMGFVDVPFIFRRNYASAYGT